MHTYRVEPDLLVYGAILPEAADGLLSHGAGQCWCTPQEAAAAASGDHPHGFVDQIGDEEDKDFRIWNDVEAVWLNVYTS